ncbi:calumenin-like, partial [Tropilaelaps mercedesae]
MSIISLPRTLSISKMGGGVLLGCVLCAMVLCTSGQGQGPKAPGGADPTKQEHTHEPPQYYQPPDPKKVKEALGQLFDEKLDANKDHYVDAREMKAWLKVVHSSMVGDNLERQWEYFAGKLQGGNLPWEEYRKVTFSDEEQAGLGPDEKTHYNEQLART